MPNSDESDHDKLIMLENEVKNLKSNQRYIFGALITGILTLAKIGWDKITGGGG